MIWVLLGGNGGRFKSDNWPQSLTHLRFDTHDFSEEILEFRLFCVNSFGPGPGPPAVLLCRWKRSVIIPVAEMTKFRSFICLLRPPEAARLACVQGSVRPRSFSGRLVSCLQVFLLLRPSGTNEGGRRGTKVKTVFSLIIPIIESWGGCFVLLVGRRGPDQKGPRP